MNCRVCDGSRLELAIDLGQQPWANHFLRAEEVGHEPLYPLRVVFCHDCATAQLDYTVPKETMFGNHTYLSGVTKSLSAHFRSVAMEADERVSGAKRSVLDIGSNDGTQLKRFQELGWEVLGVEPSRTTAKIAQDSGVPTFNGFFNFDVARQLGRTFDVINAAGVFFHLEELHSATEGIRRCLKDEGIFIVQFLYMKRIVENLAFDQIYHEHLLYYNLRTIERLLNKHKMSMFDAYLAPIHGGSIVGFVGHQGKQPPTARLERLRREEDLAGANELKTYRQFGRDIQGKKQENLGWMESQRARGRTVYGMGAPVKGNTLLNYFGIGRDYVKYLVEKNPLRKGLFSPGMHIPIVLEDELAGPPDSYYVLAWNFKKEILANNRKLLEKGVEFYFPVDPKDV